MNEPETTRTLGRGPRSIGALARVGSEIVRETYRSWREDRTLRLGAGLAYYTLFTIVPLLALTAALAESLFGATDVEIYLAERLAQFGLVDTEQSAQALADELNRRSVQSSLGIVGIASLLFASSLVFLALVDAVNVIWDVPVSRGMRNSIRRRMVSFLMVFAAGGVLVTGFAVSAVSGAAEALLPGDVRILETLSSVVSTLASAAAMVVALTMLFRFLGPVRVPWSAAVFAAAITSLFLLFGTLAIGWYLRTFGGASLSGAFGALLASLTWVYFEAQILLVGVQLVRNLTRRQGLA